MLLAYWIADGLSLWVLSLLFSTINFNGAMAIMGTAFLLALANLTIRPILKFFSLPLTILTFGLFSFVVNAVVLLLVLRIAPGSYMTGGFGTAFLASIVLGIINPIIRNFFDNSSKKTRSW